MLDRIKADVYRIERRVVLGDYCSREGKLREGKRGWGQKYANKKEKEYGSRYGIIS